MKKVIFMAAAQAAMEKAKAELNILIEIYTSIPTWTNSQNSQAEAQAPSLKSMKTETTTWSEFPIGGKAIVNQILVSEKRKM